MALARFTVQLWIPLLCLLVIDSIRALERISCLDEDGEPVDWFMVYKIPRISNAPEPFNSGFAYAYLTSKTVQQTNTQGNPYWTDSKRLISDPRSLVFRTLTITEKNQKLNSIFYSDQPPKDMATKMSGGTRAHAKGAVILDQDSETGVWLTHSVPKFLPPRNKQIKFEENVAKNGQTFMCISFDFPQAGRQIIEHLVNMNPLVYDSQLSKILYSLLPELGGLTLQGKRSRKRKANRGPGNIVQTITSSGGLELQLYSKSADFQQDIYSDWIDDELRSSLYVASWRSGAGKKMESSCPPNEHRVNNVQDFKLDVLGSRISWPYTKDHSKWAISQDEGAADVCMGDVNRMESQSKRGGGAACIKCPQCWKAFSNTILDTEPCPVATKVTDRPSLPVDQDQQPAKVRRLS